MRRVFCYHIHITEIILKNQVDIDALADTVLERAIDFAKNNTSPDSGSFLITLQGELGAGKTTFTKAFARKLDVIEPVASPTFVIQKRYELPVGSPAAAFYKNLIHIDAYRLKDGAELEKIGFEKLIKNSSERNILCIEWPEIVEAALPHERLALGFSHVEPTATETDISHVRKVTIEQKM